MNMNLIKCLIFCSLLIIAIQSNDSVYAEEKCKNKKIICEKETKIENDVPLVNDSGKSVFIRDKFFSGFSGGFSFTNPLEIRENANFPNFFISASLKYSPFSYFFFETTLRKYIYSEIRATWDPDFSYTFGYDDWHPNTFSLTYANYDGSNRLFPDGKKGEIFTDFMNGEFSLGWKFKLPDNIQKFIRIHETGGLDGNISYQVRPKYYDLISNSSKWFNHSLKLGIRYTIYEYWTVFLNLYYFPSNERQQPWDPDFTYGFGYDDWHPGQILIKYSNYSGNRYPWNKKNGDGGFFKGEISISINWTY